MGGTGGVVGDGELTQVGAVIYGADASVAKWVATFIPQFTPGPDARALGVIKGRKLVAGVVYENFTGFNITVSIAALPYSRWADRQTLESLFAFPFIQLGCEAVTVTVAMTNLQSLNLSTKLGFEPQAFVKYAAPDGSPLVILQMYRDTCRWIDYGQRRERTSSAGSVQNVLDGRAV